MEKAYRTRKRATLKLGAASSEARSVHYDLAGGYGVKAGSIETQAIDLADSLGPPIYASGSNPSFDDADNA
jgi:hypothetical protein